MAERGFGQLSQVAENFTPFSMKQLDAAVTNVFLGSQEDYTLIKGMHAWFTVSSCTDKLQIYR